MSVRIDLQISLDGYGTTTDATAENPFGEDWGRLMSTYTGTRTFRSRVLGLTDGSGSTGVDDRYGQEYFADLGAEIMGAGMFGLHQNAGDADWRGWWGDEPPFGFPVLVLTHTARPSIEFDNGTVFHFVSGPPNEVLDRAVELADGRDIRVGGGISTARAYLAAGLVDRLHVGIVPILLGRGENLWTDLRGLEADRSVVAETAESGTIHLTFTR